VLKLGGRSGSGGSKRNARRVLVVVEFALALTLLASGGLALKSFWNLNQIDLGIRPENVLAFNLPVPAQRLKGADQMKSYYRQMLERVQAVPGVRNAAVMTGMPASGPGSRIRFSIAGRPLANPSEPPSSGLQMVSAGYVETLGIRVTKGRGIDEHATDTSPRVAMVNENFVNLFFPGVDPLGQRIALMDLRPAPQGAFQGNPNEFQIVGVFHNLRAAGMSEDYPEINVPFWQNPRPRASIAFRTDSNPKAFLRSIAAAVNTVDPDMPLGGAKTVDEIISESLAIPRFSVVLFASFGALGLLLAAVGIYGVMAFGVAQRTH